ncbi:MAG: ABC transporter substrate-binding protein [Alphaproteobacteria bacterium]|nr:ABC transporter substrate-binding protein [Alphaproteobacteria bacterium]
MTRIMLSITTSCLALALAAGAQAQDIQLGAVYPLTGGVSYDGITKLNGAKLAVEEINATGGVLGRKVALSSEDGACNPAQSASSAEKLINQQKVVAIIGAICSSGSGAIAEVVKKYGIPQVTGVSTAERLTEQGNPWFFRATTTTTLNGMSMGASIMKAAGGKRFAFIVTSDDWGRSASASYGETFKKLGGEVTATEFFDRNDTDFNAALTKIRASRPEAIFSTGGFQNAANITKQARQLGIQVPILGEGAYTAEQFNKLVAPFTDKVFGVIEWVSALDTPKNKKFIADYQAKYKEMPNKFSAAGYQTVYIVAEAIKRAGSTEGEKLRDALSKTDFNGIMGNYKFDAKGQAYNFDVYLTENKGNDTVVREVVKIQKQ